MITYCLSFHIYVVCPPSVYGLWLPVVCPFTFTLSVPLQYTAYDYAVYRRWRDNVNVKGQTTGNHKLYTEDGQTTQMWKNKQQVIISCIPKMARQRKCERTNNRLLHLRCLSIFGIRLIITCCLSFHIYVVCTSSIYGLWLPVVCPFTFTLSVLLQYTAYDDLFFVLSHLRCLYFFGIRLMIDNVNVKEQTTGNHKLYTEDGQTT
jgi:hypothetical protein